MFYFDINDEKIVALMRGLRMGLPKQHACIVAGLDVATYYQSYNRGTELLRQLSEGSIAYDELDAKDQMRVKLKIGMDKAVAEGLDRWLEVIEEAMPTDWRAAAWKAERRFPEHFGKRTYEEQTHTGGLAKSLTLEEALQLKRDIRNWERETFNDNSDSTGERGSGNNSGES